MAAGRITPAKRQRRALAVDLLAAAVLAAAVLGLAAGLGVVAVIALPVLLLGLLWIGIERLFGYRVSRDRRTGSAENPKP